jgi:hypothetical protein
MQFYPRTLEVLSNRFIPVIRGIITKYMNCPLGGISLLDFTKKVNRGFCIQGFIFLNDQGQNVQAF